MPFTPSDLGFRGIFKLILALRLNDSICDVYDSCDEYDYDDDEY